MYSASDIPWYFAFALLGSQGKMTRYGDFGRLAGWLETGGAR